MTGDDVRGRARPTLLVVLLAALPTLALAGPVAGLPNRVTEPKLTTVAAAAVPPEIQPTAPDPTAADEEDDDEADDGEIADGPPDEAAGGADGATEAGEAAAEGAARAAATPAQPAPPSVASLLDRAVQLAAGAMVPERIREQMLSAAEPCLSVGSASWGRLINGVRLPELPSLRVRADGTWGTPESVAALIYAVQKVRALHPGTPPLVVGDLSKERGGRFRPHRSHQAGRDADIGYFLKGEAPTLFDVADARTLDLPRTWTFIEALVEDDKVEYIFIDRRLQKPLYAYAKDVAQVPQDRLDRLFSPGPRARTGIIRHVRGHRNHMHVRFRSAIAVAAAKDPANNGVIAKAGPAPELMTVRVTYRVKKGDTLGHIARRYKVSVKELMRWNQLGKKSILRLGQPIRILREREVTPTPRGPRTPGT